MFVELQKIVSDAGEKAAFEVLMISRLDTNQGQIWFIISVTGYPLLLCKSEFFRHMKLK